MSLPLVSIITPTFNRPEFLNLVSECVLDQNYENIEWIVLDDSPEPNLNLKKKLLCNNALKVFRSFGYQNLFICCFPARFTLLFK